ncbi:vitellogenin receptor-like [Diachasma alloeum]|uniref:vitellogenin receptor-like n=1 Tax=Diachasma alloeum TaxID=454923 RepID=UPI0007384BC0|nr:vitellogenin receptor-like [Diachasma alloeum]
MAWFIWFCASLFLCLLKPKRSNGIPRSAYAANQFQLNSKLLQLPINQICQEVNELSDELDIEHDFLIYSSRTEIGIFDLTSNASALPIATSLRNVVGVFLDEKYVYWTVNDPQNEAIHRAFRNGSGAEVIAIEGIGNPEGIAVDWITGNIYFTDELQKRIGVCTNSGSHCTSIITEDTKKPRGLVLHPSTGHMYWSDWGDHPHISRAEMNGKSRVPIVTESLTWSNGLTIDYIYSRLYWTDAKSKTIESISFVGTDRRTVLRAIDIHPYSLAVFEDRLFWSDWKTKSIQICNKTNGEGKATLLQEDRTIVGIHVYQPLARANFDNPCKGNPCGEVCLLGADLSYTCVYSLNKILGNDEKTCEPIKDEDGLILAIGGVLLDYHHEILGKPRWNTIDNPQQFAEIFHPNSRSLTSDCRQMIFNEISRISGHNETFAAIAYDHIGNNLYSADVRYKRIKVMSLSTMKTIFLSFSEEPRSILLVPEKSTMFVTFCVVSSCHIDKMSMAGSGRKRFLGDVFNGPRVPLAFDAETSRVFWADQGTGKLESVLFDGHNRKEMELVLKEPVTLAIVEDRVLGVRNNSREIFCVSKNDFSGKKEYNLTVPMEGNVVAVNMNNPEEKSTKELHECQVDNGGCSYVCLLKLSQSHVCGCPAEMILDVDQKTCKFI